MKHHAFRKGLTVVAAAALCPILAPFSPVPVAAQGAGGSGSVPPAKAAAARAAADKFRNGFRLPAMRLSTKIPANFPLPTYPKNVTRTSFMNSTKGSPTAAVTIVTKDAPRDVYAWYQNTCKNQHWSVKVPSSAARAKMAGKSDLYYLDARKEHHQLYIYCIPNPAGDGTTVNITWAYQKDVK